MMKRLQTQNIAIQTFYDVLAKSIKNNKQEEKKQSTTEKNKAKPKTHNSQTKSIDKKIEKNGKGKHQTVVTPTNLKSKKKLIKKRKKNKVNNKKPIVKVQPAPLDIQVKNTKSASQQQYSSYQFDNGVALREEDQQKILEVMKQKQEKQKKQIVQSAKSAKPIPITPVNKQVLKQKYKQYKQQKQKVKNFKTSYFSQVFQVTNNQNDKIQKKDLLAIYLFWREHVCKDKLQISLKHLQRLLTSHISKVEQSTIATKLGFNKIKLKQNEMKDEIRKLKQKFHLSGMAQTNDQNQQPNSDISD